LWSVDRWWTKKEKIELGIEDDDGVILAVFHPENLLDQSCGREKV
jgi:hypothetical protein